MHSWLLFLLREALQDCSPPPASFPFLPGPAGRKDSLPPPQGTASVPLGTARRAEGWAREGRSGWTASRHKYVWLSSHLLVGLTGEMVLFPHLLLSPKQRQKLKPCCWSRHWSQQRIIVLSGWWWLSTAITEDWPETEISGNWSS